MSADEVGLKEHFEALLFEKDRALGMADAEREKSAAVLRNTQQHIIDKASEEREKSASILRAELLRSIEEGDNRLREHISNQIQQIREALDSSEKLELSRVAQIGERIQAAEILLASNHRAAEIAQAKFEENVTDRFKTVNEFRASLDDLGKQMATRREMETAVKNLQESVEKARQERQHQVDDLRETINELRSRLDVGPAGLSALQSRLDISGGMASGQQAGRLESRAALSSTTTIIGAVVAVIVVGLAILNYQALHNNTPAPSPQIITVTTP